MKLIFHRSQRDRIVIQASIIVIAARLVPRLHRFIVIHLRRRCRRDLEYLRRSATALPTRQQRGRPTRSSRDSSRINQRRTRLVSTSMASANSRALHPPRRRRQVRTRRPRRKLNGQKLPNEESKQNKINKNTLKLDY